MYDTKFSRALGYLCLILTSVPSTSFADIDDVIKAQETKKQKQVERFSKFTKDKNVMGEAIDPKGQKVNAPEKQQFDRDGGKLLTFQSDLTYHKNAFDVWEEDPEQNASSADDDKKARKLYGFISEHGKDSEAGGSSELERKVYELHEQYNKEEEVDKEKKEGIEYKSVFKVTTKEVDKEEDDGSELQPDADDSNKEKVDVARWEVREEAIGEIEEIGENSFESVKVAAKDEEDENNEQVMPNGVLLREAANRGLKAMQVAALAALTQRRANRAIRSGSLPNRVELAEHAPTCSAWSDQMQKEIAQEQDADRRKEMEEELEQVKGQCEEISNVDYARIMPRYVTEDSQGGQDQVEKLKALGVNKEDARERDLRVQLNMIERFGVSANEVQNNWNYEQQDLTSRIVQHDENGNVIGETRLTPEQQINQYNEALRESARAAEEVNARLPEGSQIDTSQIQQYMLQKGQQAAWEITDVPDLGASDFGITYQQEDFSNKSYSDIVQE